MTRGPTSAQVTSTPGWITRMHTPMLDPDDPWPEGYRLSNTWPNVKDPKA